MARTASTVLGTAERSRDRNRTGAERLGDRDVHGTRYAAIASIGMNESEKSVYEYLTSQGLGSVVYEPDGNVPPDLLVDGRIAVEARRLNQNEETAKGHRGIEEVSKPLHELVCKALAAQGPPVDGTSWFVFYSYSRPLPPWKQFDALLRKGLADVKDLPDLGNREVRVARKMRLTFTRASKVHLHLFVLGRSSDHESGGFVVSEMAENLRICIAEKSAKVAAVRSRYSEWWLALEDRIGYGILDAHDQKQLRELVSRDDQWNRIILVNPLKPSVGFEL